MITTPICILAGQLADEMMKLEKLQNCQNDAVDQDKPEQIQLLQQGIDVRWAIIEGLKKPK